MARCKRCGKEIVADEPYCLQNPSPHQVGVWGEHEPEDTASICNWPYSGECQGVKADCLAANRCLRNLPEPVAQPGAGGEPERCAVCGWPLAESVEKGCVRGNCSMRPLPEQAYEPERANAEYGKPYFALRPAAPAEQPVGCIHCGIGPNMATELDCKEGHCHEFRPAAEQVNAEQFSVEHWKRWFVGKSFPVDMNQFWKDCMEAYAAHVTKGLQAELAQAKFNEQSESEIKQDYWNLYQAESANAEAAEARNVELMGELERANHLLELAAKPDKALEDALTLAENYQSRLAEAQKAREWLHGTAVALLDVFKEYAEAMGGLHEDDCPMDDTCNCKYRPFNAKVTLAINRTEAALKPEARAALPPSQEEK